MSESIDHCERCGEKLSLRNTVFLELSTKTGKYTDQGVEPSESQGGFAFGRACADAVLRNDGMLVRIKRRKR